MDYRNVGLSTMGAANAVRSAYGIPGKSHGSVARGSGEKEKSFDEVLGSSLKRVNELQLEAGESMKALATGDVNDVSEVAAVVSEADLSLRMAVQIRDKLVDAYNQLARISV